MVTDVDGAVPVLYPHLPNNGCFLCLVSKAPVGGLQVLWVGICVLSGERSASAGSSGSRDAFSLLIHKH